MLKNERSENKADRKQKTKNVKYVHTRLIHVLLFYFLISLALSFYSKGYVCYSPCFRISENEIHQKVDRPAGEKAVCVMKFLAESASVSEKALLSDTLTAYV